MKKRQGANYREGAEDDEDDEDKENKKEEDPLEKYYKSQRQDEEELKVEELASAKEKPEYHANVYWQTPLIATDLDDLL